MKCNDVVGTLYVLLNQLHVLLLKIIEVDIFLLNVDLRGEKCTVHYIKKVEVIGFFELSELSSFLLNDYEILDLYSLALEHSKQSPNYKRCTFIKSIKSEGLTTKKNRVPRISMYFCLPKSQLQISLEFSLIFPPICSSVPSI